MQLNQIYLGDAYELIKQVPDKSVDLVYSDIPYEIVNGGKGAGLMKNKTRRELYTHTIGKFLNGIDYSILDELVRVMKNIYIYIWCSREQIPELMDYFIKGKGCLYDILVWVKPNCTPFGSNSYLPNLEYLLLFREPQKTSLNHAKVNGTKKKYWLAPTNKTDKDDYGHPTIKPLGFVLNHILNSTDEGDVVLDPFMGSGTTAVACKMTGRQFLGFEIDPKYHRIACDRLNGITKKEADSGFVQETLF